MNLQTTSQVLWGVWVPLRSKANSQGKDLARLYQKLITYFTVLWIGYPLWIIGSSGLRLVSQDIDIMLFCILFFFSKVGFSFLDLHGLRGLQNRQSETSVDRAVVGVASPLENRVLQFQNEGEVWKNSVSRSRRKRTRQLWG